MSERELFEAWYQSAFDETLHCVGSEYSSLRATHMWSAWQASASRAGYKLVPVEASEEILEALQVGFKPDYEGGSYDSNEGYKAMIKVIDNDH